jgi:hypothetical protein
VIQLDAAARKVQTRDPSSGRMLGFGPFDALFGPDSTQEALFEALGRPMVEAALNGVNATILAYGQTGSGKTHTMQGTHRAGPGITPRVVEGIFTGISAAAETWEFMVRVSYVEIYLERVRDLLNPSEVNLTIRQDEEQGLYVEGERRAGAVPACASRTPSPCAQRAPFCSLVLTALSLSLSLSPSPTNH